MISREKWNFLTPLQKLPKNVGKIIVATGFEKLPNLVELLLIKPAQLTWFECFSYADEVCRQQGGRQGEVPLSHQGRERLEGTRQERTWVDVDQRVRPQLHGRVAADAESRQERENCVPRFLPSEGQDEDGSSGRFAKLVK